MTRDLLLMIMGVGHLTLTSSLRSRHWVQVGGDIIKEVYTEASNNAAHVKSTQIVNLQIASQLRQV